MIKAIRRYIANLLWGDLQARQTKHQRDVLGLDRNEAQDKAIRESAQAFAALQALQAQHRHGSMSEKIAGAGPVATGLAAAEASNDDAQKDTGS